MGATTVVVIDPVCQGLEHSPVNSAMLEVIGFAYAGVSIRFCADPDHLAEVQRFIGPRSQGNIEWIPVRVPPRRAEFLRRFPSELRLLRAMLPSSKIGSSWMLLASAAPSTIYAVKALQTLRRRPVPVQIVLHGQLGEIVGWRSPNPLRRATDLRASLGAGRNRSLQYVVLERAIEQRLGTLMPALRPCVRSLPHPIPPSEGANEEHVPPLPLNVAFLGLATPEKGFDVFVALAETMREGHPGAVAFHAIGRLPVDSPERDLSALATKPTRSRLPRDQYVEAIRRAHYVCLPYQGNHYELSASGALLDAVAWCKPVIALPSPAVCEMFARHPDIGYLCRSVEALNSLLPVLVRGFDAADYARQAAAIRRLRQSRLPQSLAGDYREITAELLGTSGGGPDIEV